MRVVILPETLQDSATWSHLDRIVDLLLDGKHKWDVGDGVEIESSPWITTDAGRSRAKNEEAFRKYLTATAYPPTSSSKTHSIQISVALSTTDDLTLSAFDALRCLQSSVTVLVENSYSDGKFWQTMIKVFAREDLLIALEQGWWELTHLGGRGEIRKRVEALLESRTGPSRIIVIRDRDARFPGELRKNLVDDQDTCRELNIPLIVLSKRAVENYVPAGCVRMLPRPKRHAAEAWKRMTDVQKDHYNMKTGFNRGDDWKDAPPEVHSLYSNIGPSTLDHQRLKFGLGSDVVELFTLAKPYLTPEVMRGRCSSCPYEIESILDEIESLL